MSRSRDYRLVNTEFSIHPLVRKSRNFRSARAIIHDLVRNNWRTSLSHLKIWKLSLLPSGFCQLLFTILICSKVIYATLRKFNSPSVLRFNSYHSPTLRRSFITWQRETPVNRRLPRRWHRFHSGTSTKKTSPKRERWDLQKRHNASMKNKKVSRVVLRESMNIDSIRPLFARSSRDAITCNPSQSHQAGNSSSNNSISQPLYNSIDPVNYIYTSGSNQFPSVICLCGSRVIKKLSFIWRCKLASGATIVTTALLPFHYSFAFFLPVRKALLVESPCLKSNLKMSHRDEI